MMNMAMWFLQKPTILPKVIVVAMDAGIAHSSMTLFLNHADRN